MDPERRRFIASEGGRSSHGGRGREEGWDQYEDENDDYENKIHLFLLFECRLYFQASAYINFL